MARTSPLAREKNAAISSALDFVCFVFARHARRKIENEPIPPPRRVAAALSVRRAIKAMGWVNPTRRASYNIIICYGPEQEALERFASIERGTAGLFRWPPPHRSVSRTLPASVLAFHSGGALKWIQRNPAAGIAASIECRGFRGASPRCGILFVRGGWRSPFRATIVSLSVLDWVAGEQRAVEREVSQAVH